jgi:hypothetical protein
MIEFGARSMADPSMSPSADEDRMLGKVLASAEAWLDFAVARRAFRLAGLDPARVHWRRLTPPGTRLAFRHRSKLYLDRFYAIHAAARSRAAALGHMLANDIVSESEPSTLHTAFRARSPAAAAASSSRIPTLWIPAPWTRGIPAPP